MSTIIIIVVAILLCIVLVCSILFIKSKNRKSQKNRQEELLNQFKAVGVQQQLSFTRQEVFNNRIIGLDGLHRTIVVAEKKEGMFDFLMINLSEISCCKARKIYKVSGGTAKANSKEDKYLHSIALQFKFKEPDKKQVYIPFYQSHTNFAYEIGQLYRKAKDLEIFIQKLISSTTDTLAVQ